MMNWNETRKSLAAGLFVLGCVSTVTWSPVLEAQDGLGEPGKTPDRHVEPTRKDSDFEGLPEKKKSNWVPVAPEEVLGTVKPNDTYIKGYDKEIKAIEEALKETDRSSKDVGTRKPDEVEIKESITRAERFINVQDKDFSTADPEALKRIIELTHRLKGEEEKLKPYLDDDGNVRQLSDAEKWEYEALKSSVDLTKDMIKSETDRMKFSRDLELKYHKERLEKYKKQLKALQEGRSVDEKKLFEHLKHLERDVLNQRLKEMKAMKKQLEGKSAPSIHEFKDRALLGRTGYVLADALGDAFREIWTQGSSSRPNKKYKDEPKVNLPLGEEDFSDEKERRKKAYEETKRRLKQAEEKRKNARIEAIKAAGRRLNRLRGELEKEAAKKFRTKAERDAWVKEQMKKLYDKYSKDETIDDMADYYRKKMDEKIAGLKKKAKQQKADLDGISGSDDKKPSTKQPDAEKTPEKPKKPEKPKPEVKPDPEKKEKLPVVDLPLGEDQPSEEKDE